MPEVQQEIDEFEDEFAEPQRKMSIGKEEKSDFDTNIENGMPFVKND